MEDIAPSLLEKIQKDFQEEFERNKMLVGLYQKVRDGTATYLDANEFAITTGDILANAYKKNISSDILPDGHMYYNIAKRVISPTMENNYNLITEVTKQIQNSLNENANIGIKAITPEINRDRINGIINKLDSVEKYDDIAWVLNEPVVNFSQSIVDDAIRVNAEFHSKSGMSPKITRKLAGGCCDWCRRLAGIFEYPDVPHDVYRRHQRCRCTVEYDPGTGKVQNVHTKKWQTQEERDKIEARKIIGLRAEDDDVQRYIREQIIPRKKIDTVIPRQDVHRVGTKMYIDNQQKYSAKNQYGPSYITISNERVLELVKKYSGKGKISYDRNGNWNKQEVIVTNDEIVGVVYNNMTGKTAETSVFKIHYANEGVHIVPDYPSKKR